MGSFVFFDCIIHFGGSNQSTILIIKEMQKYCDVVVLDAYGTCKEYHEALRSNGIKTIVIKPNPKRSYIGGDSKLERFIRSVASVPEMLDLIRRLRRTIKALSPRAVWTNSNKGLFVLSRAVGSRYPLAYYARGERMYPLWSTKHDWKRLSLIAGISESCLSRLRGSAYEAQIMEVVPNGIDIDETIRLASAGSPNIPLSSGLRLLYPGILSEIKNQAVAIRGLAEHIKKGGDASLWLCGNIAAGNTDAYLKKLQNLADELNVSNRVHFLGWRDNVPSVMAECDIVVLTSVTEAFGRVLLEAMCLRKPIIASRVGGIPEVVRDGVDGFLFDVKDDKEFARAVERLAEPELRRRMGDAGFERVTACYDIKKLAFRFFELISKIS